jgi:geranylgeranyl reductase family protein
MKRYDVVVVGGGPSGSTCARLLSEAGLKVLLLEKERLPRFKLCAGCLSARAEDLLPRGWKKLVLNEIRGGYLGFRGRDYRRIRSSLPVAYIVDRSTFDHFLVKEALASGADLWEETEFIYFEGEGPLKVYTNKGPIRTDFLIGADGFHTRVGRQLGYRKRKFFRSVEFWTEGSLRDEVVIDLGLVSRGYCWVFPKGDRVSVGTASTGREDLMKVLETYAGTSAHLGSGEVKRARGWFIPFAEREEDLHLGKGRVLLVGDSANLVDPLLGEGIYYSLLGGKLLAEALLRSPGDALSLYSTSVKKHILADLLYAGRIARLAYRFQRTAHRMGGTALGDFLDLLLGRAGYPDLYKRGLVRFLISSLHFENFLHIIIDKILKRR